MPGRLVRIDALSIPLRASNLGPSLAPCLLFPTFGASDAYLLASHTPYPLLHRLAAPLLCLVFVCNGLVHSLLFLISKTTCMVLPSTPCVSSRSLFLTKREKNVRLPFSFRAQAKRSTQNPSIDVMKAEVRRG